MSRTITINYAKSVSQIHTVDPNTLDDTIQVWYVVGYRDAGGNVTLFPQAPLISLGYSVTHVSPSTEDRATTYNTIKNAIAAQEGFDLASGDVVELV